MTTVTVRDTVLVERRRKERPPTDSVTVVHDYLTQRGGAERVVLTMLDAFPKAPLVTSMYNPAGTYPEFSRFDIRTMPVNKVPVFRRRHRLSLPLLAATFSAVKISTEAVLCSSSGWAHGVRTEGRKIVYCHTPARWVYQPARYLSGRGALARLGLDAGILFLSKWDRRAAATSTKYIVNSRAVRDRVWNAYQLDAEVLPPPTRLTPEGTATPVADLEPGYHLTVARLLSYKNVRAIVDAFSDMPDKRLVVVGSGPEEEQLRAMSGANVTFFRAVSDENLRWLYANAESLIAASYEDFGLTPLEAAGFGKPSVVLRWGGFLETVVEGETGVFFDEPRPVDIRAALTVLQRNPLDPAVLTAHAAKYSEAAFRERLRRIVMTV